MIHGICPGLLVVLSESCRADRDREGDHRTLIDDTVDGQSVFFPIGKFQPFLHVLQAVAVGLCLSQ